MTFHRQAGVAMAWLTLGVLAFVLTLGGLATAKVQWPTPLQYRTEGDKPSFAVMDRLREEMALGGDNGAVSAWSQSLDQSLSAEDTGDSTQVDVLWADGPGDLIWNMGTVRGIMPSFGDEADCALDARTALRLFGSLDVIGQTVTLNGRDYTISALFYLPEGPFTWGADPERGMAVLPAAFLQDAKIDALSFHVYPGDLAGKDQANRWLEGAGLAVPSQAQDLTETWQRLGTLAQLFPLALALGAAWSLLKALFRTVGRATAKTQALRADPHATPSMAKGVWLAAGLICLGLMLGAGLALWLPQITLTIPPSNLPSRWSDLGFWAKQWTAWGVQLANTATEGMLRPDLARTTLSNGVMVLGFASLMFFLLARAGLRRAAHAPDIPPWAALWALFPLAAAPFSLLAARWLGLPPVAGYGLPLLPALYGAAALMKSIFTGANAIDI